MQVLTLRRASVFLGGALLLASPAQGRAEGAPAEDPCARWSDAQYCASSLGAREPNVLYVCKNKTTLARVRCDTNCVVGQFVGGDRCAIPWMSNVSEVPRGRYRSPTMIGFGVVLTILGLAAVGMGTTAALWVRNAAVAAVPVGGAVVAGAGIALWVVGAEDPPTVQTRNSNLLPLPVLSGVGPGAGSVALHWRF